MSTVSGPGRPRAQRSQRATALGLVAAARGRFQTSVFGRWWAALLDIQFVDRAVALAAKAFVAFLPAVLAIAAVAPLRTRLDIVATMKRRLGLSGESLDLVRTSLASGELVSGSISLLSFVLLVFYATTFTSALQRVYLSAWHRPASRDRAREVKGLVWLTGVISLLWLFSALRRTVSGLVGTSLTVLLGFSAVVALWWVTSYVMLRGQVRWRVLLPPATAMAAGMSVYTAVAAVWVPRSMVANQEQFGFFGVSMTLVSWFVGVGFVVVASATLGPVLATDPGAVGRLVRGRDDTVLRPGAPAGPPPLGPRAAAPVIPSGRRRSRPAGRGSPP